jgi:hypothetical protein
MKFAIRATISVGGGDRRYHPPPQHLSVPAIIFVQRAQEIGNERAPSAEDRIERA